MATRIKDGSSIKREIFVPGIEKPIFVDITPNGVEFWAKGSRKRVKVGWANVVRAGYTGQDVPSYLAGNPLALLKHYAEK